MADFTVLRSPQRSLEQQLMIADYLRRGRLAAGAYTSDYLDDLEKQRNIEIEQRRRQQETDSNIREGEERIRIQQGGLDLETWRTGREDVRAESRLASALRTDRAQEEASRASAEASRAHAGLFKEQTAGEYEENVRKQNDFIHEYADRRSNAALAQIARGEPLDKNATDVWEKALRVQTGNDDLYLPRNAEGGWAGDPKTALRGVVDKDGKPTAEFAAKIRDLEKPFSEFGQLVADAQEARASGLSPTEMQPYVDRIRRETAPTSPGQVEAYIAQTLLDDGNVEGAMDALTQLRGASKTVIKIPDPKERDARRNQLTMVADMNDIEKDFDMLLKSGRIPVTAYRQPMFDALAYLGKDDPYIQTFRKKLDNFKARYLLYLSGRAATDAERNEVKNQIPSRFDSIQTFQMALPDFRDKVIRDIAIDNGIADSFGLQTDPSLPKISPGDLLKTGKPLPNYVTATGTVPSAEVQRHVAGMARIAEGFRRAKNKVGGVTEFRDWSLPENGMSTQDGMSEEVDLDSFTDPGRAAELIQRYNEIQAELEKQQEEGQ